MLKARTANSAPTISTTATRRISPTSPQLRAKPWLVSADEVGDPQALSLWLEVNGRRWQHGSTATMVFGGARLVSYVSRFMTLNPGDLITTGTPPGVGMGKKPQRYLKAGDTVLLSGTVVTARDAGHKLMVEERPDFLNDLASPAPTPGGGSAAALNGATGVALIVVDDLTPLMKAQKVGLLIVEPYFDPKLPARIAQSAGIPMDSMRRKFASSAPLEHAKRRLGTIMDALAR